MSNLICTDVICMNTTKNFVPLLTDCVRKITPLYLVITARKRSLRRLCFYTCLSVILFKGGVWSWGLVLGGAYSRGVGGIPACLAFLQAHSQGRSLGGLARGRSPGPHPRGKLKGIWSRPTPKGEVEGDLVQAPLPPDGYCCGRYASYWNAFL